MTSPTAEKTPVTNRTTGQKGETIMLSGDTAGNLGARIWEAVRDSLGTEDLGNEEALRLADVATAAATTAVADVLDRQLSLRVDLHTPNENGGGRTVQVFTIERTTHENAVNRMNGGNDE